MIYDCSFYIYVTPLKSFKSPYLYRNDFYLCLLDIKISESKKTHCFKVFKEKAN